MAGDRRMEAVKKFLNARTVAGIRTGEFVHRREDCPRQPTRRAPATQIGRRSRHASANDAEEITLAAKPATLMCARAVGSSQAGAAVGAEGTPPAGRLTN